MDLIEHFLRLHTILNPKNEETLNITRAELTTHLCCSERNVIHILHNLEKREYITWKSGRGRGNSSTLTFHKDIEQVIIEEGKKWIKESNYSKLFFYLENYLSPSQKQQVFINLPELFGYKQQHTNDSKSKDVLTFPYFRKLFSLDPSEVERQSERHIVTQIFDRLIEYQNDEYIPKISHYWNHDESFQTWTFHLRKGVLFHNQQELTSKDVKFTFERLKDTPLNWLVPTLDEVKIIDMYTVQFYFIKPNPYVLDLFSSPKCSIIPFQFSNKKKEDFQLKPIGTGPFFIKKRNDESFVLSAHPTYYWGRPHLDEINMIFLPDMENYDEYIFREKQIGYVPFLVNGTPNKSFNQITRKHLSIKYLIWNMNKKPPYEIRKIVSQNINKKQLVNSLKGNRESPTDMLSSISYNERVLNNFSKCNEVVKLKIATYDLIPNIEDLRWLQTQLDNKNIKIDIHAEPYLEFIQNSQDYDADLFYSEYVIEDNDIVSLLNLFHSPTSIVKKSIGTSLDIGYTNLQKHENQLLSQYIIIPLYTTVQRAFFHESLKGTTLSNVGLASFKDLFFIKNS